MLSCLIRCEKMAAKFDKFSILEIMAMLNISRIQPLSFHELRIPLNTHSFDGLWIFPEDFMRLTASI